MKDGERGALSTVDEEAMRAQESPYCDRCDGFGSVVAGAEFNSDDVNSSDADEDVEEEGGPGWLQSRGFRLELGIPVPSSARSVKTRCIIRVEVKPILNTCKAEKHKKQFVQ